MKTEIRNELLDPSELGLSIDEAFSAYLLKKKQTFLLSIRFISGLKIVGIIYSVLLSYFVSSTVELATFTGFSQPLLLNLTACFFLIGCQYFIGTIRGDESLKLGSRMDQGFVENISQLSLVSQVSLTPRFVAFVKELRVARTEYAPELLTIGLGTLAFMFFAYVKGAFLVFLPMPLILLVFLIWTYIRRKENAGNWDIQERLLERGLNALEESETESVEPVLDERSNLRDIKEYFRIKVISFKEDFVTKSLIIFSAINAALVFSSTKHPDRIVLSTLGLFAAKMLQDSVPVWLEILRTKEIAKSIKWPTLTQAKNIESKSDFNGEFKFKDVSFRYGPQVPWLVFQLNFEIKTGDTLLISGPSGSGKSTFLKLITGEVKPTEGEVEYNGLKSENAPEGFFKVAGHSAHDSTFPNIKVKDLFSWYEAYHSRKDLILDCVELHPRTLSLPYAALSQGEKKKVSIAVALFQCQGIVILDEPYSGFDQNYGLRLAAKLAELPYTKVISITDNNELRFTIC
ncbi:MAG: ATP-binding cassette domain-containing protein [Bdellovibrionales bacterium]|nr:ATP-binding cassette domain-containing protein [Bdellovibrionales bacterium]